ncbi:MAG: P-loop NTPase [Chitinivibrionales bacterium]|nr:P-loop NTPase [Chitinivibrionales bacterium]MBD3394035.1 P-loop NTPase [Chitinivibrionales bacterium]
MMDQAAQLRKLSARRNPGAAGGHPRRDKTRPARRVGSCRSIAVTSGKGGVGKSSISLFLAQSLARLTKRVLVFDADLGLANIHILMGVSPRYNLAHVVRGECALDDIVLDGPGGVRVAPGASGIEAMANLDSLGIESLVRELVTLEEGNDFLIVDIGAGIGQNALRLSAAADSALLVLTPEPTSLADAYATAKLLFAKGMRRIAVLVNMASSDAEGREIFDKFQTLVGNFLNRKLALAGILPFDKDIPRLVRSQRRYLAHKPKSTIAVRMNAYARALCGLPPAAPGNFFTRLFGPKAEE